MPKLRKPMLSAAEKKREAARRVADIIEHAMIDAGLHYDKELAQRIGMTSATFSKKKKLGTWTWGDLYDICVTLDMPETARARMLGQ